MDIEQLDFEKSGGLIPAIIQDAKTYQVLMLGYMNREAVEKTIEEQKVTFYSRSKERLWTKGETSGNYLDLVDIQKDCDSDTLLILANPHGPTCHTGEKSCFFEKDFSPSHKLHFLADLENLIQGRKENMPEDSYTTYLFEKGIDQIAQKVGEEAVETVIASKNDDREEFINESADLIYHLLVLLTEKGIALDTVIGKLEDRHKK